MTEWFVYCNTSYYPWAEIVQAETPEEAACIVARDSAKDGVVVLPASAITYAAMDDGDVLQYLRDEGERMSR